MLELETLSGKDLVTRGLSAKSLGITLGLSTSMLLPRLKKLSFVSFVSLDKFDSSLDCLFSSLARSEGIFLGSLNLRDLVGVESLDLKIELKGLYYQSLKGN